FVDEWSAFLAVRSLFGIGMGGIWGLAASNGLENMPVEARGLFSGILQQGYACGYLIAAVVNLTLVHDKNSWRPLFYLGSGLSLGGAVFRLLLPESEFFLKSKAAGNTGGKSKFFFQSVKAALKLHWQRCIFAVLLMSGFNFFSHGSQDLYPTYLKEAKLLSDHQATVATIIGNCGAIVGGTLSGYLSQYFGRRLVIIGCCLWTACWIPLTLPDTFGRLATGAFFVQSGVQGAWGVVPAYLQEISPPAFRATFPGVAYQLGNMVSSASSQIEATAGESSKTTVHGKVVPDYAKIQAIFIGIVAAWIIFWCLFGSEYHGSEFEKAKTAAEEGAGADHEAPAPTGSTSSYLFPGYLLTSWQSHRGMTWKKTASKNKTIFMKRRPEKYTTRRPEKQAVPNVLNFREKTVLFMMTATLACKVADFESVRDCNAVLPPRNIIQSQDTISLEVS
ncbi:MFS general substrate transporter, partial [Atractiella rhizophila]